MLEDQILREKLFHFDHERIPESVVHARGFGAHGYFETLDSLSDVTFADIFQRKGEKTPLFIRFSTVAGNKGSFHLARDVRGFAVKFYTKEGNWDLVGNNIPVFFIQDASKFPDLIHAAKGKATFVKFHWIPKLGLQSVMWNEAVKINGADPDYHRRDLWNAITAGDFPEWELGVQLFDESFAEKFAFDVLDATKLIPDEEVSIRIVGRMVLDRVVDNFFAETEQVAFCTQNIVRGIDHSEDPLLQGRSFSYLDTQLKRLGGPNFTHIPINAPKCPVHNFQQDGHMAMHNPKRRANYEPNSWGPEEDGSRPSDEKGFTSYAQKVEGTKLRVRSESFADHYSQARQFYISQTPVEQKHIKDALVFELSKVEHKRIRERMVSDLLNIDQKPADMVASGLGLEDMPEAADAAMPTRKDLLQSDKLSILKNGPDSFKGRKMGILMTYGADADLFEALEKEVMDKGAMLEVVAPKVGGVKNSKGKHVNAQQKIDGGPSVLYDAIAIIISDEGAKKLAADATARDFVSDAYAHCKYIGYTPAAKPLLDAAGILDMLDEGCVALDIASDVRPFTAMCADLRHWEREPKVDKT